MASHDVEVLDRRRQRSLSFAEIREHLNDPKKGLPREVYEIIKSIVSDTTTRMKVAAVIESQRRLSAITEQDEMVLKLESYLFDDDQLKLMKRADRIRLYSIVSKRHDATQEAFIRQFSDQSRIIEPAPDDVDGLMRDVEEKVEDLASLSPEKARRLVSKLGEIASFTMQKKSGLVTMPPIVI